MTGVSNVRIVDAVAIALLGGFLAGIAVGTGYAGDNQIVGALGAILFGSAFALAYVRLSGVPDVRGTLARVGFDDSEGNGE